MATGLKHVGVEAAIADLRDRTLAGVPGEVARLLYLSSTRDYNTGQYYHDGLALQFTEDVARNALAACHQEVFRGLVFNSVKELVQQLNVYLDSDGVSRAEVLRAWQKLEPYRVTIPLECDPLTAKLFFSNFRTALAVLEARQQTAQAD
jgi:hypothetical protein